MDTPKRPASTSKDVEAEVPETKPEKPVDKPVEKPTDKPADKDKDKQPEVNENEFPRMMHRKDERMLVTTPDELKQAKGDGWTFHHEPPAPVTTEDDGLEELSDGDAIAAIQEIDDVSQLETLRNEYVMAAAAPRRRPAVVRAIDKKIEKKKQAQARLDKPHPEPFKTGSPAAGLQAVQVEIQQARSVKELQAIGQREAVAEGGGRPIVLAAIANRMAELA